ncbi:unnamed protein product [Trichobilharzia regenti]|nr:unnamed protein product [Trichobilharzia regenti]
MLLPLLQLLPLILLITIIIVVLIVMVVKYLDVIQLTMIGVHHRLRLYTIEHFKQFQLINKYMNTSIN